MLRLPASVLLLLLPCLASASDVQVQVTVLPYPDEHSLHRDGWLRDISGRTAVGSQHLHANERSTARAVIWNLTTSAFTVVHPAGYEHSRIIGTDSQQHVGYGAIPSDRFNPRALLWSGTTSEAIQLHPTGFTQSQALATSGGKQVGFGRTPDGKDHALLWSGSAALVSDLHPIGATNSQALGTHGTQQAGYADFATGRRAVLWNGSAAEYSDLHPDGYTWSYALAAHGSQQVGLAGGGIGRVNGHAILWNSSAERFVDLHPWPYSSSRAVAVSAFGQVGSVATGSGGARAALWFGTSHSFIDLQSYLTPLGLRGGNATGIDDFGNISGFAYDMTGKYHPIIWSVPEPSTALPLICFGTIALQRRNRLAHSRVGPAVP